MEGEGLTADRDIDRAVRHVETMWLPYDREWVRSARARLSRGEVAPDAHELTDGLMRDPGLFGICLRSLPLLETGGRAVRANNSDNLPALFRTLSRAEWLRLLPAEVDPPTMHTFEHATPVQVDRWREISFAATASEMLASNYETDPEVALSCSMLRQLGMALIAWNYPTLYSAAVTRLSPQEGIDRVLTRRLGFSPTLLAITLARKWGVSPRLLRGIGGRDDQGPADTAGERLDLLCRLGESLAMARSAKLYPDRRHDWEEALAVAERILGPDALEKIAIRASEKSEVVARHFPKPIPTTDRPPVLPSMEGYPMPLRTKVAEFYRDLPRLDAGLALRKLIEDVAPVAGYTAGAIFVADPVSGELTPQASFDREPGRRGGLDLRRPIRFDQEGGDAGIVSRAFLTETAISGESSGTDGVQVFGIAGRLEPGAVLYLEQRVPPLLSTSAEIIPHSLFNLLRQAAAECIRKLAT